MQITITRSAKEPRVNFAGRPEYGVLTSQFGNDQWINLECDFRPTPGQTFDVNITDKKSAKGFLFKNATIIGPAPQQTPQQQAQPPADSQPAAPAGGSGRIPWGDWARVIRFAWAAATEAGMPVVEAVAVVNTTLIAFSNGKIEVPAEAREPGQDDDDIPEFLR